MKKNKKIKFYCNIEDLNEYEKEHNKISYRRLVERVGRIWLFNKAPELSNYDFDFLVGSDYDEESDNYVDIYQYYLIDTNEYMIEKLQKLNCKDLIIAWSDTLEEYVLFVDHFGTGWDYVLTDIEPCDNFNESDL